MIIEAIKKGDGYFIPLKGKKEKIKLKIEFIEDDDEKVEFSDEYIEKHWKELIMTTTDDSEYYKSEEYKIDRAKDWEERGKI